MFTSCLKATRTRIFALEILACYETLPLVHTGNITIIELNCLTWETALNRVCNVRKKCGELEHKYSVIYIRKIAPPCGLIMLLSQKSTV